MVVYIATTVVQERGGTTGTEAGGVGISGDSRVRVTRWNVGKGRNEECGIEASQLRKDLGRGEGKEVTALKGSRLLVREEEVVTAAIAGESRDRKGGNGDE